MKKTIVSVLACVLLIGAAFGMTACNQTPEVAATFEIAGSLQALYGENGYPQAVLVAKTSVIEEDPAAVAAMTGYMEGAESYLSNAQASAVVTALSGCYEEGLSPSLNANNLTKEVIANCSVKFSSAKSAKERVKTFLGELIDVSSDFTAMPEDGFFYEGTAEAGTIGGTYTVYAPDGAPALALANAVSETEGETFEYHIVAAATIAAQVTGAAPKADFCVLPVNAAAKLLGKGTAYKMLGVVTNGNMYFIRTSTDQKKLDGKEALSSLVGKKVGVVQLDNVPGLTFQAVLKKAGIAYQTVNSGVEPASDKVNLVAFQDAKTVSPAAGCDYYLCPEPAATTKVVNFKTAK